MKKLIIAAAIVCAAAASQAAIVDWTIKNVYDPAGTAKITASGGYSMYLFTTEIATVASWSTLDSTTALASKIGDGQAITITADGNAIETSGVSHSTLTALDLVAGETYDFYAVAYNGKDKFYITTTLADQQVPVVTTDALSLGFGSQSSRTKTGGASYVGWTTVSDTPEPTSGLLLLVGMASLALRRRRA